MLGLVRRADHHLPRDFAIQIHRKVLLEAIEGFGAAFTTGAHVFILARDASDRRDMLLDTPPSRPSLRVWFSILRDNLGDALHDLLYRRFLGRQGASPLSPRVSPSHRLQ